MKLASVGTDAKGNINIEEVRKAAEANKDKRKVKSWLA